MRLRREEAVARVNQIGIFSETLGHVLSYLLEEVEAARSACKESHNAGREAAIKMVAAEADRWAKALEAERAERRTAVEEETEQRKAAEMSLRSEMEAEGERLSVEAKALKDRIKADKEEMRRYLEQDAAETREKAAVEAAALRDEMHRGSEAISARLEADSRAVDDQLAAVEAQRKAQGSELTQMFDRLRAENERRKEEIGEVRETLSRDTEDLRAQMEAGFVEVGEAVARETEDCRRRVQTAEEDVLECARNDKRELTQRFDAECRELQRRLDVEAGELRVRLDADRAAAVADRQAEAEARKKEVTAVRTAIDSNKQEALAEVEKVHVEAEELKAAIKKEKADREKDLHLCRDSFESTATAIRSSLESAHRESCARQAELQHKLQTALREETAAAGERMQLLEAETTRRTSEAAEAARADRQKLTEVEAEAWRRIDAAAAEQRAQAADVSAKMALIGKSASRHIEALRHKVFREYQSLFDLATKPCSVAFNAVRDDVYVNGGEEYVTFSACSINIGNAMNPKSGEFRCPEAGLYLFLVTLCTLDMKKCLVSVRRNGKDVASIFDQDGEENKGKTMVNQSVLLELAAGDRVQLYAYTSTGFTDHKASKYTQFLGMLLRPSVDRLAEAVCNLGVCADNATSEVADDLEGDLLETDVSRCSSARSVVGFLSRRGSVNGVNGREVRAPSVKRGALSPPPPAVRQQSTAAALLAAATTATALPAAAMPVSTVLRATDADKSEKAQAALPMSATEVKQTDKTAAPPPSAADRLAAAASTSASASPHSKASALKNAGADSEPSMAIPPAADSSAGHNSSPADLPSACAPSEASAKEEESPSQQKAHQSYLALTGLGMGMGLGLGTGTGSGGKKAGPAQVTRRPPIDLALPANRAKPKIGLR